MSAHTGQRHTGFDELAGPDFQTAQNRIHRLAIVGIGIQLLQQCGTLFGDARELLQRLHVSGLEQSRSLIHHDAACSRIAGYQPLIFGSEGNAWNLADDIAQIQRRPRVDAGSVGTTRMNRRFIRSGLTGIISDVRADGGRGLPAFDQRQRAGRAMTRSGGQHFDGFHQIGFAQAILAEQDIHAWYEIDHYLTP